MHAIRLRLPDCVEEVHKVIVDHERNGNIQSHTTQSRDCTFVEAVWEYMQRLLSQYTNMNINGYK